MFQTPWPKVGALSRLKFLRLMVGEAMPILGAAPADGAVERDGCASVKHAGNGAAGSRSAGQSGETNGGVAPEESSNAAGQAEGSLQAGEYALGHGHALLASLGFHVGLDGAVDVGFHGAEERDIVLVPRVHL